MPIPDDPYLKWAIPEEYKREYSIEELLEFFCEYKQLDFLGDENDSQVSVQQEV